MCVTSCWRRPPSLHYGSTGLSHGVVNTVRFEKVDIYLQTVAAGSLIIFLHSYKDASSLTCSQFQQSHIRRSPPFVGDEKYSA